MKAPTPRWTDRIGRRLKLRDLHVLMAVVQWGSMARAAEHLAVSQPVVSKTVADLEHAVGVRLLDRSPRGVEPTIYGRALLDSSMAAFDELKLGIKQIEFLSDPNAGEVRVGCGEMIAAGLAPAAIERMRRKHPRIAIQLVGTPTAATFEYRELRERHIDLLLGRIPEPILEQDLHADVLFHDRLYVVAGKTSKWARRRDIALAELINEEWLLPTPNTYPGSLVAEVFQARNLPVPRASAVSLSLHLHNSLLPTGRYVSVLPGSVLHFGALRSTVKALPVDIPVEPRPFGVVTLKHRTLSPVTRLFIEVAREVGAMLTKQAKIRTQGA